MPSGLDKSGTETKQYQVKDEERQILPSISGHRLRSLEPVEGVDALEKFGQRLREKLAVLVDLCAET